MKNAVITRMKEAGIIPVVVLDRVEDAVPTACALLEGGIHVMEVTFRTQAAPEAIRAIAAQCPQMLVGAGTICTVEQCRLALQCGARFLVSPGFDPEVVSWCVGNDIPVVPGCVTPTEIMGARKYDLKILKFFPAQVYGGLSAMKSLSGPFGDVKFIPTGGINTQNVDAYIASSAVFAVGGSWVCSRADILSGNFSRITALCKEARRSLLGFMPVHLTMRHPQQDDSALRAALAETFGFSEQQELPPPLPVTELSRCGRNGQIGIQTNSLTCAMAELREQGIAFENADAAQKEEMPNSVYLIGELAGFTVQLLQKGGN